MFIADWIDGLLSLRTDPSRHLSSASRQVGAMEDGWLAGKRKADDDAIVTPQKRWMAMWESGVGSELTRPKRKAAENAGQAIKRQIIEGDLIDPTNKRSEYVGTTPSKNSKTGQVVIDRMIREGNVRQTTSGYELLDPKTGAWVDVDDKIHMGHKIDAVTFWNKIGRYHGEKSAYVRNFMLDPNNYELQIGSYNSSAGASLRQQYQEVSSTRRNSIYGDDRLQHYNLTRESMYD